MRTVSSFRFPSNSRSSAKERFSRIDWRNGTIFGFVRREIYCFRHCDCIKSGHRWSSPFNMKNNRIPPEVKSMKLRSLICPLSTKRDPEDGAFPTAEDDGSFPVCSTTSQHNAVKNMLQKNSVVVSKPNRPSTTSSKKMKILRRPFKVRVSIGDYSNQGVGGSGKINVDGGEQDTIKLLLLGDDENDEMPLLGDPNSKEWSLSRWIPGSGLLSDPEPC